jgi:hypothetical protein
MIVLEVLIKFISICFLSIKSFCHWIVYCFNVFNIDWKLNNFMIRFCFCVIIYRSTCYFWREIDCCECQVNDWVWIFLIKCVFVWYGNQFAIKFIQSFNQCICSNWWCDSRISSLMMSVEIVAYEWVFD